MDDTIFACAQASGPPGGGPDLVLGRRNAGTANGWD